MPVPAPPQAGIQMVHRTALHNAAHRIVRACVQELEAFDAACLNLGGPSVCSKPGAIDLAGALAPAIMANQAVCMISPASGAAGRRRQNI